jgi:hypothetical protein
LKITHTDGSITDTDKLNDCSAELMERMADFQSFCKSRQLPMFLRVVDTTQKMHGNTFVSSGAANWDSVSQVVMILTSIEEYFLKETGTKVIDWAAIQASMAEKEWKVENE